MVEMKNMLNNLERKRIGATFHLERKRIGGTNLLGDWIWNAD